jgi:hypothetical protein
MSASTTEAPLSANMRAVASPMPLAAPVTRATWPLKSYIGFIWIFHSAAIIGSGGLERQQPIASLNPPYELATAFGGLAATKVSFDAFNANGDRTGPIENRDVIRHLAE